MKKEFHIYIFRHGQTFFNKNKIFTGWKDSRLTPEGIRQARAVARKLKNKKFEIAFCSDLQRAKRTLGEVLKYHKECKRITVDRRIRERNYGKLNGRLHKEIIDKFGQEQFDIWHRGFSIRPPGGESFADVEKRVGSFIRYLVKFIRKNRINVAISAHGNSIRLFRKIMEKKSEKEAVKWKIPYDRYFEYKVKV
jgi:2,3-bisphosphoglycerate-dependent phosphoglycerate mutase